MAREEASGSQAPGRHKEVRQAQSRLPGAHPTGLLGESLQGAPHPGAGWHSVGSPTI